MKLCRCGAKIPYYKKACEKCLPIIEHQAKERYKAYARNRKDKDIQKIYSGGKWDKVKEVVKTRQNGICLYSFYIYGEVKPIEMNHHIVETKEDITKAYDPTNVIGITESVHKLVHKEYLKGKRQKKAMQELLLNLIDRWKKDMNMVEGC